MSLFDDFKFSSGGNGEYYNLTDDAIYLTAAAVTGSFNAAIPSEAQLIYELQNSAIAATDKFIGKVANDRLGGALGTNVTNGSWAGEKGNQAGDAFNARLQEERKASKDGRLFKFNLKSLVNPSEVIVLDVSPEITDSHQATYEQLAMTHAPFTFQVYKNSSSRTFEVQGKLISRNSLEATRNLNYINILRSWTKPYFGAGTASGTYSKILGAPPDILSLSIYGPRHINAVPVVLASASWPYPTDCDYIPTCNGEPFPVIMTISLTLLETYSPEQVSMFNMQAYKAGRLGMEFTKPPAQSPGQASKAVLKDAKSRLKTSIKTAGKKAAKKAIKDVKKKAAEICFCKF